jgi:hypothetical protein
MILDMFVPLSEPQPAYSVGTYAGCFYVPSEGEYKSDGTIVLNGGGSNAWYLHEDGKLHRSAYEDDDDGNITSNGYFPSLSAAEKARQQYYAAWSQQMGANLIKEVAITSRPLFED